MRSKYLCKNLEVKEGGGTYFRKQLIRENIMVLHVPKRKCIGMYYNISPLLFAYFLVLPSLLHSSVISIVFVCIIICDRICKKGPF